MSTFKLITLYALFFAIWAMCMSYGILGIVFGWMPAGIVAIFVANMIL